MDQLLVPSGIRFNDYIFSQPIGITACTPPGCGGVYAVLVTDPNWAPKPFQPVFFGQLGNNAPRHSILQECAALGPVAASQGVFVAVLPMPFSTSAQRNAVQRELIQAYNPLCQTDALRGQPGDIAQNHGEIGRA